MDSLQMTSLQQLVTAAIRWDAAHQFEIERPMTAEEQTKLEWLLQQDEARHGTKYAEEENTLKRFSGRKKA